MTSKTWLENSRCCHQILFISSLFWSWKEELHIWEGLVCARVCHKEDDDWCLHEWIDDDVRDLGWKPKGFFYLLHAFCTQCLKVQEQSRTSWHLDLPLSWFFLLPTHSHDYTLGCLRDFTLLVYCLRHQHPLHLHHHLRPEYEMMLSLHHLLISLSVD